MDDNSKFPFTIGFYFAVLIILVLIYHKVAGILELMQNK